MVELPESTGELLLTSNGPNEQPFIDCRYLEASRDRERLPGRESFNDIADEVISPVESDLATDDTLDQWLLENVWIGQHLSGTCKMGPDSDTMAVVDQFGRVRYRRTGCGVRFNHARRHPPQRQLHHDHDRRTSG